MPTSWKYGLVGKDALVGVGWRRAFMAGEVDGVEENVAPQYRQVIDALVQECLDGEGQIAAQRARSGVWNQQASADWGDRQMEYNQLLDDLDAQQRDVLASLICEEFVSGIHAALVVLHEHAVPPFEDGYEGTPFHDFMGRLDGWQWPPS